MTTGPSENDERPIGVWNGERVLKLLPVGFHIVEIGVLRGLDEAEDDALVLRRGQFLGGVGVKEPKARDDAQGNNCGGWPVIQARRKPALIPVLHGRKGVCDDLRKRRMEYLLRQQRRRHHWRERQGDDARHDHGACQRKGEFLEENAGNAAEKADWRVDRGKGDGHGDDRAGNFARADQRGLDRRFSFLDMPEDVFDHDDGVVDHEADGEHHRQQRQKVDAEP